MELKGVEDLELSQRFYDRAEEVSKPWEKYDLMKQYRSRIPEPEEESIMADVYHQLEKHATTKKDKRLQQKLNNK